MRSPEGPGTRTRAELAGVLPPALSPHVALCDLEELAALAAHKLDLLELPAVPVFDSAGPGTVDLGI